jgi:predicted acyl esterase
VDREKGSLLVTATFLFASIGHAVDRYPVTFERNVAVSMRDAVTLRADICWPGAEGKFPVLLE